MDSLTKSDEEISPLLAPNVVIINNAAPPVYKNSQNLSAPTPTDTSSSSESKPINKRQKRAAALESLTRELRRVWDIDNGNGRRTVIYESRNFFTFAADVENPVCMPEAGTIELEKVPDGGMGGIGGWWATELRSWHDRVGLREKRAELGC
jgi:hypothetical protein